MGVGGALRTGGERAWMEILMLLIPMSVALVALIGIVFWWSVRSGQFDDLEGPAHRILNDDETPRLSESTRRERRWIAFASLATPGMGGFVLREQRHGR